MDPESVPDRIRGVEKAAQAGWQILLRGGTAVDAIEAAVVLLEDDPLFNAGTGSVLNSDGQVENDAAIMDGSNLKVGAVAAVTGVLNPIQLARRVMDASPHVLMVADGAKRFARAQGITECDPAQLATAERRQQWQEQHGTVGACARDSEGKLAAATSTGGSFNKIPGRVGDSPLVGCGTYANRQVAVSCTGRGEQIIRMTLARLAAFSYEKAGDPQEACNAALGEMGRTLGGDAGIILADHAGRLTFAKNTHDMPVCAITADGVLSEC